MRNAAVAPKTEGVCNEQLEIFEREDGCKRKIEKVEDMTEKMHEPYLPI